MNRRRLDNGRNRALQRLSYAHKIGSRAGVLDAHDDKNHETQNGGTEYEPTGGRGRVVGTRCEERSGVVRCTRDDRSRAGLHGDLRTRSAAAPQLRHARSVETLGNGIHVVNLRADKAHARTSRPKERDRARVHETIRRRMRLRAQLRELTPCSAQQRSAASLFVFVLSLSAHSQISTPLEFCPSG